MLAWKLESCKRYLGFAWQCHKNKLSPNEAEQYDANIMAKSDSARRNYCLGQAIEALFKPLIIMAALVGAAYFIGPWILAASILITIGAITAYCTYHTYKLNSPFVELNHLDMDILSGSWCSKQTVKEVADKAPMEAPQERKPVKPAVAISNKAKDNPHCYPSPILSESKHAVHKEDNNGGAALKGASHSPLLQRH